MFRGCKSQQPLRRLLRARRAPARSFASQAAQVPSDGTQAEKPPTGQPQIIFSGIQPTGAPHLGNYLGALREWKRLQDTAHPDTKLIFSIVDLHALTVQRPSERLYQMRHEMMVALLALGLDPSRCTIFFQSQVPAHAELQWLLSCTASMGYLSRMTQWKSKVNLDDGNPSLDDAIAKRKLKHGLFSYPILQAADIAVHRATHVPVGDDQRQHLEFARDCIAGFNNVYRTRILVRPRTLVTSSKRVMSLRNPTQKMSKSDPASNKSCLFLNDTPEAITEKIMGAVTDSNPVVTYEPEQRPGVANLVELLASFDPQGRDPTQLAAQMEGRATRELKEVLAQVICDELAPFREKFEKLKEKPKTIVEYQRIGAKKANESANHTMELVKKDIGLNKLES